MRTHVFTLRRTMIRGGPGGLQGSRVVSSPRLGVGTMGWGPKPPELTARVVVHSPKWQPTHIRRSTDLRFSRGQHCCKYGPERHGRTLLCEPAEPCSLQAVRRVPMCGQGRAGSTNIASADRHHAAMYSVRCCLSRSCGYRMAGRMRPAGVPRLPADQHADANARSVAHLSSPSTRMPMASAGVLPFMPICGRTKL